MSNGAVNDTLSLAIGEVYNILMGQYAGITPVDEFGLYKELITWLREDLSERGIEAVITTWESVKNSTIYTPIDIAITQGWVLSGNRQQMGFMHIVSELSLCTSVDQAQKAMMIMIDDCAALTKIELLQVTEMARSRLVVPISWINQWRVAVNTARAGAVVGAVAGVVGGTSGSSSVPRFPLTDLGNAERMVDMYGSDMKYVHLWGKWLVWDNTRWITDQTGDIYRKSSATVRSIYSEVQAAPTPEVRERIAAWAHNSENSERISAVTRLAKSRIGVPVMPDQLDANPYVLSVKNGVIDLETGDIRPPRRGDLISKQANVNYIDGDECPLWDNFLMTIMSGSGDKVNYLRRCVGYTLTGLVDEQAMFFCYGRGKNGKSTFLEVIMAIFNDYAIRAAAEMLMTTRNSSSIPNDVARLPGVRLVIASEVGAGHRLDESKVKNLTGKDTITARFMRSEFFDFKPIHKLWMYGNYKPNIRGADEGIWRRIQLIPFPVQISAEQRNTKMQEVLLTEASGILNWAIRGCLEWQQEGLNPPDEILKAILEYREDMDIIGEYLNDRTVNDPGSRVATEDIYNDYVLWCLASGDTPLDKRHFIQRLTERGYEKDRLSKGVRALAGLKLV